MKKLLFYFASLAGFIAINIEAAGLIAKKFPEDTNIAFELMNKSGQDIYVAVFNGGINKTQKSAKAYKIKEPGFIGREFLALPLKKNELVDNRTFLAIWTHKPGDNDAVEIQYAIKRIPGTQEKMPVITLGDPFDRSKEAITPDFLYTFNKGKTLYLTYDGRQVRPQTGVLEGKLGITRGGYSLENNIKNGDIIDLNK